MKILSALRFPLRRPLRLAALALAQSLFLWLMIAALEATNGYLSEFKAVVNSPPLFRFTALQRLLAAR